MTIIAALQEFRFCRGKCHKAFKKHRNPRKVKWTKIARKCAKKELTDDLAQTFEKKRNSLLRYERDSLMKTMEAVPKIVAIKQKREAAFIRKRLMKGIENRKAEDVKLVKTQMHLIKAPNAKEKAAQMETSSSEEEEEAMDVSLSQLEAEAEQEKQLAPKKAKKEKRVTTKKAQKLLAKA